jgi:hypothetical protein
MRISGCWVEGKDSVTRPSISTYILNSKSEWEHVVFLIDTGADRTVFSAELLRKLDGLPTEVGNELTGAGGSTESVTVETKMRFLNDTNAPVTFSGKYFAFRSIDSLDTCVIGRDILNHFAVIIDYPGKVVELLHGNDRYRIERA